ncbi:hypothetical protein QWY31_16305, partial [Cytophagales bacterium LB-30]
MNYKKILIWGILIHISFEVFSQDQLYSLPIDKTPPSTEAASLGNYGNIPVNMVTGVSSYELPMFTMSVGNFQIPVKMSYYYSGFRPSQEASNVGMGWSLSTGGVISRVVNGLPDEEANGYSGANEIGLKIMELYDGSMSNQEKRIYFDYLSSGLWDGSPDDFSFSGPGGLSGKFFIDAYGEIQLSPKQHIKIEKKYVNGSWTGFIITNSDGVVYIFETREITSNESSSNGGQTVNTSQFPSSWYLSQIHLRNNDIVNLFYEEAGIQIISNTSETESYKMFVSMVIAECNSLEGSRLSNSETIINKVRLDRIESRAGVIDFEYNFFREDNSSFNQDDSNYALSNVYYKDYNNNIIKHFKLDYGLFGDSQFNYRLKLNSVAEIAGTKSLVTAFTYYEDLPFPMNSSHEPTSKSIDHWGFYNGIENTSFLPSVFVTEVFNGKKIVYPIGSANRSSIFNTTRLGALKQINYPTGGYSSFDYEGNDIFTDVNPFNYGCGNQIYSDSVEVAQKVGTIYVPGYNEGLSTSSIINLENSQCIQLDYSLNILRDQYTEAIATVQLINQQTGAIAFSACYQQPQLNPVDGSYSLPNPSCSDSGQSVCLCLDPGAYSLEVFVENQSYNGAGMAKAKVKYTGSEFEGLNFRVGGIRTKVIVDYDGINLIENKFIYNATDFPDRSSGKLISYPHYSYDNFLEQTQKIGSTTVTLDCGYKVLSNNSQNGLVISQGSHVVYNQVTQIRKSQELAGKTITYFNLPEDIIYEDFPFPDNTSFEWARVGNRMIENYGPDGVLKSSIIFYYDDPYIGVEAFRNRSRGIKVGIYKNSFSEGLKIYSIGTNFTISDISRINKIEEITYGEEVLTSNKYFFWESPATYRYTKMRMDEPDGASKEVLIYTPTNYTGDDPNGLVRGTTNSLLRDNVIQPLQIVTRKNNLTLQASYSRPSILSGKVIPAQQFSSDATTLSTSLQQYNIFDSNNQFYSNIQITALDTYHNVTEYVSNQVYNSSIYGYNALFPIARITNAPLISTAFTNFESSDKGQFTYTGATATSYYRTGARSYYSTSPISKGQLPAGTYTVSAWARTGSGSGTVTVNGSSKSV